MQGVVILLSTTLTWLGAQAGGDTCRRSAWMWIRPRKCCSAATISHRGETRSDTLPIPPPPPTHTHTHSRDVVVEVVAQGRGRGFCREHAFELSYDLLICAVGAISNTFHTPGVEEHAFFLKVLPCPLGGPPAPALSQSCRCCLLAGRLWSRGMPTAWWIPWQQGPQAGVGTRWGAGGHRRRVMRSSSGRASTSAWSWPRSRAPPRSSAPSCSPSAWWAPRRRHHCTHARPPPSQLFARTILWCKAARWTC